MTWRGGRDGWQVTDSSARHVPQARAAQRRAASRGQDRHPREGPTASGSRYTWRDYFEQAPARSRSGWPRSASRGATRSPSSATTGPQLYWAVLAAQALGGVPVPIYQDSIEKELRVHRRPRRGALRRGRGPGAGRQAPARHAPQCPRLESRGLRRRAGACAATTEPGLAEPGRAAGARARSSREATRRTSRTSSPRATPEDTAHHLLHLGHDRGAEGRDAVAPQPDRDRAQRRARSRGSAPTRRSLSYLPMAWVGDHVFSVRAVDRRAGSRSTARRARRPCSHDLKEIGPTYFFAPPADLGEPPHHRHGPPRGLRVAQAAARPASSSTWPRRSSAAACAASRCRCWRRLLAPARARAGLRAAARQPRHAPRPSSPTPRARPSARRSSCSSARSGSTSSSSTG